MIERLRAYYVDGAAGGHDDRGDVRRRARQPAQLAARLRRPAASARGVPDAARRAGLAAANKRIANILRKAAEPPAGTIDTDLLRDPAEQVLGEQVLAVAREVEPMFAARDYTEALQLLAALRHGVDDFFDGVMVMADDPVLRGNRLALLGRIQSLFLHAADLSRLPG